MSERLKDRILVVLAVLCIVLGALLAKREVGGFSPNLPPNRYRDDIRVQVRFTESATAMCGIIKAPAGSVACAPVGGDLIIAPNPCNWRDPYAKMMCHEIGHSLGWPADHPK